MATYDVAVVGSGINSLVCAARLARAGKRVVVLERNDRLGGCIRTEELFPGFRHDVLSSWYPLFVTGPAYAELGDELEARGLELVNTETPTGVLTSDGESTVLHTEREATRKRLNALAEGDGDRYGAEIDAFLSEDSELTFGFLGNEPMSWKNAKMLWKSVRKAGALDTAAFFGRSMEPCRAWLERSFSSEVTRALLAPWVLHAGLGPDDAYSGLMGRIITATLELAGLPVVRGGSDRTVAAFQRLIEDHGGEFRTEADVERVVVTDGKARGVRLADGEYLNADAVVCSVTPTQLYGRLLDPSVVPERVASEARAYRFGRADMQIHFALEGPPRWPDAELASVPMVHLTPGLDGVSRAVNEAERGLLPVEGTIVVGQPTALDPSRAPDGKWILWIQLQELPSVVRGDAAGEIDPPPDGTWTEDLREAYADRIQARLATHLPGLEDQIIGRRAFSPADLEDLNANLVGGDPYAGACTLDQFFLWRPMGGTKNHETPVDGLFHIGASTHPGPGLAGGSGYLVADQLT